MQGIRRTGIDEVPIDVEHTRDALLVGIHLTVLLIVESLQFQDLTVLPVATLVVLVDVVQLRIKREHVQVQLPVLDVYHGSIHVADKLTRSRAGRMHSDAYNRTFQGFALLSLCRSGTLRTTLLVAVYRINQARVGLNHRVGNLLVELLYHVLTSTRVTNDEDTVVQSAHQFRLKPEVVPRPCHQGAEEGCRREQHGRQLIRMHIQEQLLHAGVTLCHFLQFLSPFCKR